MRAITSNQLRAVQATMSRRSSDREERLEMLSEMCGRTVGSTKELSWDEANLILDKLGGDRLESINTEKQRLRAAIYHLSMGIGFLNKNYPDKGDYHEKEMNKAKVDMWLVGHGVVKKRVKEMTIPELGKVIGQMKAINKTPNNQTP